MNITDSIRNARRSFLMSKKTRDAIAKREAAKAKVTKKPAVTKAEERKADKAGGSEPA